MVEHLLDAPVAPGFTACSRTAGVTVVMPAPADDAPFEFLQRYLARVVANATEVCSMCSERASLSHDPDEALAAWRALPVTYGITHLPSCPCTFTEADRPYFDPRAFE